MPLEADRIEWLVGQVRALTEQRDELIAQYQALGLELVGQDAALQRVRDVARLRPQGPSGDSGYSYGDAWRYAMHHVNAALGGVTPDQAEPAPQPFPKPADLLDARHDDPDPTGPLIDFGPAAPEPQPATTGETDGAVLARLGTDGRKWASEFGKTAVAVAARLEHEAGGDGSPASTWEHLAKLICDDDPGGWLHGWFANAIEAGRSAGTGGPVGNPGSEQQQ
jgi:hypothetical protein